MVAFDLDGTLTLSKQSMSIKMAEALKEISSFCHIAIVSGASKTQFMRQVIPILEIVSFPMPRLFLITTNGGKIYHHLAGKWNVLYPSYELSDSDYQEIYLAIEEVCEEFPWTQNLNVSLEEQIEHRNTQITFSALGQNAALEQKVHFDPNRHKRIPFRNRLAEKLSQYDVKIGGTTSVDVTMKGVSKVSGLLQVMNLLSLNIEDVLYVGDALYEGGNDRCVKDAGFRCVEVESPFEAGMLIDRLLYPYLYVQPEGEELLEADPDYIGPRRWKLRDGECENHIWYFPGGKTKTRCCLGCGKDNPTYEENTNGKGKNLL